MKSEGIENWAARWPYKFNPSPGDSSSKYIFQKNFVTLVKCSGTLSSCIQQEISGKKC